MPRIKDKIGKKIGRLTVIENSGEKKAGCVIWKCKCDCGNFINVSSKDFAIDKKRGVPRKQSCGCLNDETRKNKSKYPIPPQGSFIQVLEEIGITSQKKIEYKCLCIKCNREFLSNKKAIRRRKQCDFCNRKELSNRSRLNVGKKSKLWRGVGDISKSQFTHIKNGAKKRNIKFDITLKCISDLWETQKGICALSGIKLNISERVSDNINTTASLDRIDSSIGYIKENIQWVHKDLNKMKWGLTSKKFIEYCKKVSEYDNS